MATSYVDGCVVWLILYGLVTVASLTERNALIMGGVKECHIPMGSAHKWDQNYQHPKLQ